MFQLILLAAIVYILYRWLRRDVPRRAQRPPDFAAREPRPEVEEMVQDPVCGTWVPVSQAQVLHQGGKTLHFCSRECRDKFLRP